MYINHRSFIVMLGLLVMLSGCMSAAKIGALQSDYQNARKMFNNLPDNAKECAPREYAKAEGRLAHIKEELGEKHWPYAQEYMPEASTAVQDTESAVKRNCPPRAKVTPPPPPPPPAEPLPVDRPTFVLEGITFDFDKATIRDSSQPTLNEAGVVMQRFSAVKIRIEGHTDSLGSDDYNQGLSERRANSVKEYLGTRYGVDSSRIETVGYGEAKPVTDNSTEAGRAQNRRIEIWVTEQ